MSEDDHRDGETRLGFDPADQADASVSFIGHIRSDWSKGNCPRNIGQSRQQGGGNARIELLDGFALGLAGMTVGQAIWVVTWMDAAPRDLIVQRPGHTSGPRGVFRLRSPARPNPVAMSAVRITSLDLDAGVIGIDATDAYDGTPIVDIKPWIEAVDIPPAD
ncbi:TrmO family methyltransferase domain-containing protein [Phaeobacter marinintestinus]|uniref:TrmO family methyltransferase domain-containing protein n=1 Tax=Falsiphaeobacter marinintestinus TaxID=1492905 RepID=UPI0011B45C50|nr:TrmO family methyltransferase [Phaeobacter marinintestinus]